MNLSVDRLKTATTQRLTRFPRLFRTLAWVKRVSVTFLDTHCSMHAAGLTYYSLLALVPAMCVLLLLARILGADQLARDHLHERFESQIVQFEASAGLDAPASERSASEPAAETPAAAPERAPEGAPAVAPEQAPAAAAEDDGRRESQRVAATRDFIRQARGIESGIMERIEKFDVGRLGWIGLLFLLWTVVGSIGMVEVSFNEIWAVHRQRSFWRRVLLWSGVTVVLPVLSVLAVSVPLLKFAKDIVEKTMGSLWLTRWVSDGTIWLLDSSLFRISVSLFFSMLTFAFLFKVLPNRPVRARPALCCGLATAVLFNCWFKLCAIAQIGIANTSAVYGSFAFLPIVLAWLYMSWQIILLGCCMVRVTSTP